ncbi:LuxR C-terminal-related transcriptional regulator [Flexivirga sp.]|uniref:LuxR C-terminal-related transcriptional regulator n=1 Tax=Flexivirga sp. TaxID=1962927 RepID=UPI003F8126A2
MRAPETEPIRLALLDDYDVVLKGLARMLEPYQDRVVVTEIDANKPLVDIVDIALYDSFAQGEADAEQIDVLVASPRARRVVVYTWSFHPKLVAFAQERGVDGYLSKTLPAHQLVEALEAVHAGRRVVSDQSRGAHVGPGLDWPGRHEGLTDRESEILALITQGRSNAEIAALTYLSPNTIKSYVRSLYRKIGADSRTKAVLWGIRHGFSPDHHRIELWRDGR